MKINKTILKNTNINTNLSMNVNGRTSIKMYK